jgi:hypothetical protein
VVTSGIAHPSSNPIAIVIPNEIPFKIPIICGGAAASGQAESVAAAIERCVCFGRHVLARSVAAARANRKGVEAVTDGRTGAIILDGRRKGKRGNGNDCCCKRRGVGFETICIKA